MPFDGPIPTTKPDLRILSDVLRGGPAHPMWPDGFVWSYIGCNTCAMGIAGKLWGDKFSCTFGFTHDLGMAADVAERIFCKLGKSTHGKWMWDITPTDVADAIDAYPASRSDA